MNEKYKDIIEEFEVKFNKIDVNECGYDEQGEPDNKVIIDKADTRRVGLDSVKDFLLLKLEETEKRVKGEILKSINGMPCKEDCQLLKDRIKALLDR